MTSSATVPLGRGGRASTHEQRGLKGGSGAGDLDLIQSISTTLVCRATALATAGS